jgi:hypothetical protein
VKAAAADSLANQRPLHTSHGDGMGVGGIALCQNVTVWLTPFTVDSNALPISRVLEDRLPPAVAVAAGVSAATGVAAALMPVVLLPQVTQDQQCTHMVATSNFRYIDNHALKTDSYPSV